MEWLPGETQPERQVNRLSHLIPRIGSNFVLLQPYQPSSWRYIRTSCRAGKDKILTSSLGEVWCGSSRFGCLTPWGNPAPCWIGERERDRERAPSSFCWKKSKVKCTLVQALRLCTGRTARRGSTGIALPFLDYGTRRGWGVSLTPRPLFIPGKDPVPIVQEAGWAPGPVRTGAENLVPTGIWSPDRPARSQSLYRLSYPPHVLLKDINVLPVMGDEPYIPVRPKYVQCIDWNIWADEVN